MSSLTLVLGVASLLAQALSVTSQNTTVITKDVIIIGGGAGGAHAAVRLMRDMGQNIVLIEQQSILVSHSACALQFISIDIN